MENAKANRIKERQALLDRLRSLGPEASWEDWRQWCGARSIETSQSELERLKAELWPAANGEANGAPPPAKKLGVVAKSLALQAIIRDLGPTATYAQFLAAVADKGLTASSASWNRNRVKIFGHVRAPRTRPAAPAPAPSPPESNGEPVAPPRAPAKAPEAGPLSPLVAFLAWAGGLPRARALLDELGRLC